MSTKLYQLKRELITDNLREMMPNLVEAKHPINWWLENNIAEPEDLEEALSEMYCHGFKGSVEYSIEDKVYFGEIEGIKDLVSFEGEGIEELKTAFIEAVEDYMKELDYR